MKYARRAPSPARRVSYGWRRFTGTAPVSMQTLMVDDVANRTETVGRVHPHLKVKIVDSVTGDAGLVE